MSAKIMLATEGATTSRMRTNIWQGPTGVMGTHVGFKVECPIKSTGADGTLVPGTSIFYPWTLLTSGFVETNIIQVSLDTVNHTTHFFNPLCSFSSHCYLYQPHSAISNGYGELQKRLNLLL